MASARAMIILTIVTVVTECMNVAIVSQDTLGKEINLVMN